MDSMSSINSRLSNEGPINVPSPVFPASMFIPKSRHSIDLGSPPLPPPVQNSLTSPRFEILKKNYLRKFYIQLKFIYRSRLSLDLSSPTSELPANTVVTSTIISPRYTEFKSYSSTFDGLQALENSNCNNNNNSSITVNSSPSMRVSSSLPAISPPGINFFFSYFKFYLIFKFIN